MSPTDKKRVVGASLLVSAAALMSLLVPARPAPSPGPGQMEVLSLFGDDPYPFWGSGTDTATPTPAATSTPTPEPFGVGNWYDPPELVLAEEVESFYDEWPESAEALENAKLDIQERNFRHTDVSPSFGMKNGCGRTDPQTQGANVDVARDLLFDVLGPADLTLQGLFEWGPRHYVMVFTRGVGLDTVGWPTTAPTPHAFWSPFQYAGWDSFQADALAISVATFPSGEAIVTGLSDCGGFHESIGTLQEALDGRLFFLTRW